MSELEYEIVNVRIYNKNIWDFCNSKRFLVSVVVVAHQRKYNLGETLYSIVKQKTDFDFEIVIIDDASTDGTEKIIEKECGEFIQDKRVKHIKICTRMGYTKPSYIGAAASDGEYIVFQPSDIIPIWPGGGLQDQAIQKLIEAFDENTVATFARECRVFGGSMVGPEGWRENPKILKGMSNDLFTAKAHASSKGAAWFSLGAIRWTDYRRLTDFRAPYPDSRLSAELNKDGRDLKFLDDIIAVHFPHDRELLNKRSSRWWTVGKEPF